MSTRQRMLQTLHTTFGSICLGSEHEVRVFCFGPYGLEATWRSMQYDWRHYANVCSDLSFPKAT